jgi:hypothetical protein
VSMKMVNPDEIQNGGVKTPPFFRAYFERRR